MYVFWGAVSDNLFLNILLPLLKCDLILKKNLKHRLKFRLETLKQEFFFIHQIQSNLETSQTNHTFYTLHHSGPLQSHYVSDGHELV